MSAWSGRTATIERWRQVPETIKAGPSARLFLFGNFAFNQKGEMMSSSWVP